MSHATPILETRGLCRYYRRNSRDEVRALHDITLGIARGSFTVLTGASGSGKTTLLALLGTLERPTQGQVLLEGRDLGPLSDNERTRARRRIGFVFQNFSLIPGLSVWENITYPLIPRGVGRAQRLELARTLLDRFGLAHRLGERPSAMSGGEQQRVAIARALVGQPDVLLADEPTSNLDRQAGRALLALLREIHQEGKTVVVATHDPAVLDLATVSHELVAGTLAIRE